MFILYVLAIAYILAVNFYAFLLVKSLADNEKQTALDTQLHQKVSNAEDKESTPPQKYFRKLLITGALGGAITVYVCMFLFKYKRSELALMVLMPLLGVLNIYSWILLFRYGLSFFVVR